MIMRRGTLVVSGDGSEFDAAAAATGPLIRDTRTI